MSRIDLLSPRFHEAVSESCAWRTRSAVASFSDNISSWFLEQGSICVTMLASIQSFGTFKEDILFCGLGNENLSIFVAHDWGAKNQRASVTVSQLAIDRRVIRILTCKTIAFNKKVSKILKSYTEEGKLIFGKSLEYVQLSFKKSFNQSPHTTQKLTFFLKIILMYQMSGFLMVVSR